MTDDRRPHVGVVGAGIAGLVAARELTATGATVTVLEKAKGVGGRMATRRIGDASFDHGAQFLTARHPAFVAEVEQWREAGVVRPWFEGVLGPEGIELDDGEIRWRGHPSMTAPAKHLATGLEVRLEHRVAAARLAGDGWELLDGAGRALAVDGLVLTAPVPQTLQLLASGTVEVERHDHGLLERVTYDRCLAVMVLLGTDARFPTRRPDDPVACRPGAEPIAWFADNRAKGISGEPALTLHLGPTTSEALWDASDGEVLGVALDTLPLEDLDVIDARVHRWRYATAATPVTGRDHLLLRDLPPAVLAGDAFGADGRVEGAALSGLAAARALADALTRG